MTKDALLDRIRKHHLFEGLPDSDLAELVSNSEWKHFRSAQTLFEAGEPAQSVYIIGYGAAKLIQLSPAGEEIIMHLVPAGGLVAGVVAMQENGRYPLTAVTMEDSGVIKLRSDCFRKLVSTKGKLAGQLLAMVAQRIADLHGDKMTSKGSVPEKIADFLLRQLEKQPAGSGTRITMRLTRQDIANSVGTTVETVIRVLSQWTQKNIISTQDHHIEILNKSALREIIDKNQ